MTPVAWGMKEVTKVNLNNLLQWNSSLFSGINANSVNKILDPKENIPPIDGDLIVSNIMLDYGLCTPVYGEPDVMQVMVSTWWDSNAWNFAQMWRSMHLSYSPIENYDRHTDNKRTIDREYNADNNTKLGGTDTTQLSGDDTAENTVSAFNETTYQPKDKTTARYGKKTDINYGRSSNDTLHDTHHDTDEFHERVHGNIGVTTTQQMIDQELKLRQKNVYSYIADSFADKFVLAVW